MSGNNAAGRDAVRVIGVGNPYRSDDGVGPFVAARLRERGLAAEDHSGEGAGLIEAWQGGGTVIVIDATRSGSPPGAIRRFDAAAATVPTGTFHYSTHLFGLAEAIETARALGRLPPQLIIYGIEGQEFGFGDGLSDPVTRAAAEVVERIIGELG